MVRQGTQLILSFELYETCCRPVRKGRNAWDEVLRKASALAKRLDSTIEVLYQDKVLVQVNHEGIVPSNSGRKDIF